MSNQSPPAEPHINQYGGEGAGNYGPPAPPPVDPNAAPPAAASGDYGAQAAQIGTEFQQTQPTQVVNPRTVYNFSKPEILPGPGDFSEVAAPPPPPPPGYDFQGSDPSKQANWDKLTDQERWVRSALPGVVSGTFADIYKKWDATWPGHSFDIQVQPLLDSVIGKAATSTAGNFAGVGAMVGAGGGIPGMVMGAAGTAVTGAVLGAAGQAVAGDKGVAFVNAVPNYLNAAFQAAHSLLFRTLGVADQAIQAYKSGTLPEFEKDFKAAWYAGDLEADMGGNPLTLSFNPIQNVSASNWAAGGQLAGMAIPFPGGAALGGVVGGIAGEAASGVLQSIGWQTPDPLGGSATLVQARQQMAELMAQGVDPHDALIQVRSDWYQKLGALSFRAQTNNLITGLLANPLFPVMEGLKPVERVAAIQKIVAGMDAAPEAVTELGKAATEAEGALKTAMDAHDAAVAAGTATLDTQAAVTDATAKFNQAQGALEAAQKTGLSWGQQKLVQLFGAGDEAAGRRNLIALGGGLENNPEGRLARLAQSKWNPLALTPEARASELMTIFNDNVASYHVAANTDATTGKFDLLGAERSITRAADGINDPRLGNAMLSYEGRSVAPMVGNAKGIVEGMATVHRATEFEQTLLAHIAQVLGDTPEGVMARLADGDPGQVALLNQYMQKAAQMPGAAEALQGILAGKNVAALDQGLMARVFHVLKDIPYTDQQELATLINKMTDGAAQQAILQFHVKQTPLLTRIAEMTKAAESLAHFRVNPAYPIRMFITDTVNMLRDGTFGTMSNGEIDGFWKTLGFEPARLYQSVGYTGLEDFAGADKAVETAGPMVAAQADTQKAIYAATNAKGDAVQKITRWLGSVKPPDVLNAQTWARDITAMASKRAYTTGYIRGLGQFMPAAVGKVIDNFPDAAAAMGPQLSRTFENALGSVRTEAQLDAMLAHPNLNLTLGNVIEHAETDTGLKLDHILGPEVQAKIEPIIQEAAASGDKAALDAAFERVNADVQAHLETLHDSNLSAMRDEAFAKTMAEKSGAGPKLWMQANDEIISAQIKHTMDQAYLQEQMAGLKGSEATAAWTSMRASDENFFNRAFTRAETTIRGFADAAGEAKLPGGDELLAQFNNWRYDAQKYITDRNDLWSEFWDATGKGEKPPTPYAQIIVKNDNGYRTLIERERAYQQSMDAGISKMLPPEEQPGYLAWRNRVATLRTADKAAVLDFRQSVRGLRGKALEDAYSQFNQERLGRLGQLQFENSAGQAMMQGVPQAAERYTQSVATAKMELDTLDQLMPAKLQGDMQLPPEAQAQLDQVIAKYATPQEADALAQLRNEAQNELRNPPTKVELTPEQQAAQEQQAISQAIGESLPSSRGIDFENARRMGPDKNGNVAHEAPQGAEVFDFKSPKTGIDGKNKNRWTFDPGTDYVEAPKVWTNEAKTTWQAEPPSAKGAILRNGNKVVKLKTMADTLIAANGEVWKRMPANEIDGWVEKFATSAGYDIGNTEGISWDTISKDLSQELKGEQAPQISVGGQALDASKLSPDLLKNNPELLAQLAPPKPVIDTETLAANQADRAQQQMSLEWDVWQRVSQAADEHAAANVQAQATTEGLAGTASAEPNPTGLARTINTLPTLKPGYVRVVHLTSPNAAESIAQSGLRYAGTIDTTTRAWQDAETANKEIFSVQDPRFKNHTAVIMDIPVDEYNREVRINSSTEKVSAERVVGIIQPDQPLGEATPGTVQPYTTSSPTAPTDNQLTTPTEAPATPESQPVQPETPPITLNATHPDTAHQTAPGIPDLGQVVKPSLFQNAALDEHWYTRGSHAVDAMKAATLKLMDQSPVNLADIPAEAQAGVRGMIQKAYGDLADARYASMRFGEYTRDSALLNYNRRYNFDSWLSNIFPYEFWTTHSAFNWVLHSIDRPAMLASYLRFKQFMATAGAPQQGFPTRLQGTLKIPLPFMPDFMGHNVYIDPLKLGLPFEGWQSPFDQFTAQEQTDLGAATRELQALVNDGKIAPADQADALKSHAGPTWERAVAQAQLNDQQGGSNYMDLLTSLLPPHLPLLYAYDAAQGQNPFEKRGDILPITRTLGGLLSTLGVQPGSAAGWLNPEANIRKALGLHPFGQWDDYYAERQITDELGLSKISVDDARQAMLTHQGPVWDAAVKKAQIEMGGGGPVGAAIALAGVPVKSFPPGEEYLRSLAPEYKAAWAAYDGGDMQAINKFNDAHPGYEERLALFKSPEARLHQFTQDQFWNTWQSLPTLTRDELKNQLSPDFQKMVGQTTPEVSSWRRNVSTDQMAVWLKLMGADPVGSLGTEAKPLQDTGSSEAGRLKLDMASPELAQRAQVFYTTRSQSFGNWYDDQKGYYAIPAGQKVDLGPRDSATAQQYLAARDSQFGANILQLVQQYDSFGGPSKARTAFGKANPQIYNYFTWSKAQKADPAVKNAIGYNDVVKENTPTARSLYAKAHPQLTTYWAWRDSFLTRNPDLAPYLSDQTKGGTVQAPPKPAMQAAPQYTPQEWQQTLGWNLYNLVQDTAHDPRSYPLSPVARDQLAKKAKALGYSGSVDDLARIVAGAH